MKKMMISTIAIVIIIIGAVMGVLFFGSYSSGSRTGYIIKISKKGFLFKTLEGQLAIESFGAIRDNKVLSTTFDFSVSSNDIVIYEKIMESMRKQKNVILDYDEKYTNLFFAGDTKYFVTNVQILE